ncbi:unnamed protein product [Adineta steineri]|uniref:Transcription initiation factor IIA subunit 2 n=1 Tax=Adineta steineri TaxID=433720 RepID=A0A818ZIW6_9BILA|nr:unnamed protein product [Adineta steineri]CAF0936359.1 unnamed protein product [Adineta steineri]CAF0979137.1 unnamed protein product [Adineta steineri]CAF3726216.1 unnamed protein product [Adineta steineri]CAF3737184.1 unnamed protein product [Adineta steineri]
MATYQLYRNTTLGVTLQDTLDEMISQGQLTELAASKVLSEFDRSINVALDKRINKKVQFSGKLSTYRFCDNVWTLVLKDFSVKESNNPGGHATSTATSQIPKADKVKIVACDGKSALQS